MPKRPSKPPVTRPVGKPPHAPTKVDRDTVSLMVAGGIAQSDIALSRGISGTTLRKHYRDELAAGATVLNTVVILEIVKKIKGGDFTAMKWWTQARMGWRESILVDDGKPADTPMRVIVEFVGDPAPQVEQLGARTGPRLSDEAKRGVHLVG